MICSSCGEPVDVPNPHAISTANALYWTCKPCNWFERWLDMRKERDDALALVTDIHKECREQRAAEEVQIAFMQKQDKEWNELFDRLKRERGEALALEEKARERTGRLLDEQFTKCISCDGCCGQCRKCIRIDRDGLRVALRRARGVIADMIKAEDERNEAASRCCDEGLIDRDCADDCPQDDTCDCPGTALISQAINRRNFHEGDCLRAIDAALATGDNLDSHKEKP